MGGKLLRELIKELIKQLIQSKTLATLQQNK